MEEKKLGIIAFAFGQPWEIPANYEIARTAQRLSEECDAPVYTQKDIFFNILPEDVEYIKEDDTPPPTLRIARGAVQWAKKKGITTLLVIAAEPHRWRAIRDVRAAIDEQGLETTSFCYKEWKEEMKELWFSSVSTQKRTRSWWGWWPREIIARLLPLWLYKIIAS